MHTPLAEAGPDLWARITDVLPGWVVAGLLALLAVAWLVERLTPLGPVVRGVTRLLHRPDPDARRRAARLRVVARHVQTRLLSLAEDTRWDDGRYAELEAEVEIEGRERTWSSWRGAPTRRTELRRVRSLTAALARSTEPIIVLEGEPGSGKSVALRHLAQRLAAQAVAGSGADVLVPLYVDLKRFQPDGAVTPDAVGDFVRGVLTSAGDREIDGIVDEEFDEGLRTGRWLLLFDSFDEIAEVLSAAESDSVVRAYAEAIVSFLRVRGCRAVIASREFRGPPSFRLPRFRVMRLGTRQQRILVRRSGLPADRGRLVMSGIAQSGVQFAQLTGNPLFLWLLCEYLREHAEFPENAHSVFSSFVDHRLSSDAVRIQERYGLSPQVLRAYVEELAFCMAARHDLGLDCVRDQLRSAVAEEGRLVPGPVDAVLDALILLRLGRDSGDRPGVPAGGGDPGEPRFAFTHRRLQEYFATCVVLRQPDRVPLTTLLTDGRWRETAITILQTQPPAACQPLLAMAQQAIDDRVPAVDGDEPFRWPPGLLHLLEIVATGLGRTPERIPSGIRLRTEPFLDRGWRTGRRHDRLWILEVAVTAPPDLTATILDEGLASASGLLQESAYRRLGWLPELTPRMLLGVRRALFALWAGYRLGVQGTAVRARLRRLSRAPDLWWAYWLMRIVPGTDLVLVGTVTAWLTSQRRYDLTGIVVWTAATMLLAHAGLLLARDGLAGAVVFHRQPPLLLRLLRGGVDAAWLRLVLGVGLRAVVAFVLVMASIRYAIRSGDGSPGTWLLMVAECLAVLYACFWADVAMNQVRSGGRVAGYLWPVLPVVWAVRPRPRIREQDDVEEPAGRPLDAEDRAALRGVGLLLGALGVLAGVVWLDSRTTEILPTVGRAVRDTLVWLFSWWQVPDWLRVAGRWLREARDASGPVIGLVMLVLMAGFVLWEAVSSLIEVHTERRRYVRRWQAATTRTEPFDAAATVAVLSVADGPRALRELVNLFRETPRLCTPAAAEILSDLAATGEFGGHQRYSAARRGKGRYYPGQEARVRIPDGCSAAFRDWVEQDVRHAATLVHEMEEDLIDDITRLVTEVGRPAVR